MPFSVSGKIFFKRGFLEDNLCRSDTSTELRTVAGVTSSTIAGFLITLGMGCAFILGVSPILSSGMALNENYFMTEKIRGFKKEMKSHEKIVPCKKVRNDKDISDAALKNRN